MKIRTAAVLFACLAIVSPASAQVLPSEPVTVAGGRVTVAGDVSAAFGSGDPGFFNYTDYEHSALRMLRIDLGAVFNAGDHFAVLGELRTENSHVVPYALYVRVKPWMARPFDIQVGRVPPTFGAFARRTYATDNPLIGYPLAYKYLTSLRADSLPANADELLRMRGRGWLSNFSIGRTTPDRGVPLVSAFRWDTGVQVHAGAPAGLVNVTASVTAGTLSNPRFSDDNGGRQVAGRIEVRPSAGLTIGTSLARGPFVASTAAHSAVGDPVDSTFSQTGWGLDAEYSRDYYVVRVETVLCSWTIPAVGVPAITDPLRAVATAVEGRYKFAPGFYAAARVDHLGFSTIQGETRRDTWDAPVSRVEVGGGYSILRNLLLKLSYQHDRRPAGRVQRQNLGATQLVWWF
jgi:hypothetical protein